MDEKSTWYPYLIIFKTQNRVTGKSLYTRVVHFNRRVREQSDFIDIIDYLSDLTGGPGPRITLFSALDPTDTLPTNEVYQYNFKED